jgi:hypothetical protein
MNSYSFAPVIFRELFLFDQGAGCLDADELVALHATFGADFGRRVAFVFESTNGTLPGFGVRHNKFLPWLEVLKLPTLENVFYI